MKGRKRISAEELDKKFDDGEDISEYLDYSKARHPNLEPKRVNCDFPAWMVNRMDQEAKRLGVARLAVLKAWVAEKASTKPVASPRY